MNIAKTIFLGKISSVGSTSLFLSKDYEFYMRLCSLRRLSFVLWSGPVDEFLPQLPSIQEKLVKILKVDPDLMHAEAYLCLRVLICRMSNHHLSNLWPIVLTELVRCCFFFDPKNLKY